MPRAKQTHQKAHHELEQEAEQIPPDERAASMLYLQVEWEESRVGELKQPTSQERSVAVVVSQEEPATHRQQDSRNGKPALQARQHSLQARRKEYGKKPVPHQTKAKRRRMKMKRNQTMESQIHFPPVSAHHRRQGPAHQSLQKIEEQPQIWPDTVRSQHHPQQ